MKFADFVQAVKSILSDKAVNVAVFIDGAYYFVVNGSLLAVDGKDVDADDVLKNAVQVDASAWNVDCFEGNSSAAGIAQGLSEKCLEVFESIVSPDGYFVMANFEQSVAFEKTLKEARAKGQAICDAEVIPTTFSICDGNEMFVEEIKRTDAKNLSEQVAVFNQAHGIVNPNVVHGKLTYKELARRISLMPLDRQEDDVTVLFSEIGECFAAQGFGSQMNIDQKCQLDGVLEQGHFIIKV